MADNKVKFLRGTAAEYAASTKDNDVFYYITDTQKLYLGANEVTGEDITVDNVLSSTSENPVQNKVIKGELDKKGTYSKPTDGIPKSDLASAVQTSLGKADTALQEHQSLTGYVKNDDERLTNARPANGGNADTVNGHTVNADVPADAKFTDTTYFAATTSANGLMSAADKTKLDGIATGATKITVDTALSSTSTNPVQNKVINTALAGKAPSSHTHNYAGSSSAGGVANSAVKLNTKPYSITISTSDWTSNFSGGYMATKTITGVTTADNYIADVLLSSDQSAAKLQLEAWSYICDGNIVVTADNTVVFYAFTTKPTTNVTIEMQVIS